MGDDVSTWVCAQVWSEAEHSGGDLCCFQQQRRKLQSPPEIQSWVFFFFFFGTFSLLGNSEQAGFEEGREGGKEEEGRGRDRREKERNGVFCTMQGRAGGSN